MIWLVGCSDTTYVSTYANHGVKDHGLQQQACLCNSWMWGEGGGGGGRTLLNLLKCH